MRTLLVEGWRNIAHSYAIVNQFQCLEMLKTPDVRLFHRDVPYYGTHWERMPGLFPPMAEAALNAIPSVDEESAVDAVLRISFPYNCAPSNYARTIVFGTSEFGHVPPDHLSPARPLPALMAESDVVLIVPSHWSRNGFLRSGALPHRVEVVPHGIDPAIYFPPDEAHAVREQSDTFTFLTVGSMSGNKGMLMLLRAFAEIARKYPHVRLTMKGLGALYPSRDLKDHALGQLGVEEMYLVRERLNYVGEALSFANMAELYRAADAYVSPYLGEGFNLPVLEAAACGALIICTKGGSTDDFVRPEFALQIDATLHEEKMTSGAPALALQPNFDHLVHQMKHAIENQSLRARARVEGPVFVAREFTWRHAVQRLLEVLFP